MVKRKITVFQINVPAYGSPTGNTSSDLASLGHLPLKGKAFFVPGNDTEQNIMGGEYRPPVHALAVGLADRAVTEPQRDSCHRR